MSKMYKILSAIVAFVLIGGTAFCGELYFTKGERKTVWIRVAADSGDFTIDSSTWWVKDQNGVIFSNETSSIIDGHLVGAMIDTGTWTEGSAYDLYIHWETDQTEESYISPVGITVTPEFL